MAAKPRFCVRRRTHALGGAKLATPRPQRNLVLILNGCVRVYTCFYVNGVVIIVYVALMTSFSDGVVRSLCAATPRERRHCCHPAPPVAPPVVPPVVPPAIGLVCLPLPDTAWHRLTFPDIAGHYLTLPDIA